MTTTINVSAHCADHLQVLVSVTGQPDVVLQNGEATTVHAYDDRVISVREEPKPQPGADEEPMA